LALETIDLNGSESIFSIGNKLGFNTILPSKVTIWKLRCNNPMRKTFVNNNIKLQEFESLIKITSEMAKYLYPYIRAIISSKDNFEQEPELWNDFQNRFTELIQSRFNTDSIRVKNLVDHQLSSELYLKILITLSLCISDNGYSRLKTTLLNI
tara:strand:+ start:14307 stop:14765 length:459 start_codon:yes stop_codon:yes gene_type:complete